MNKLILLLMSLCICATSALFSQDVYVKIGGAYRIGYPANYIGTNLTAEQPGTTPIAGEEGVYGSFGSGKEINCAIGFTGKNLGIEIGVVYVFKSAIDVTMRGSYKAENGSPNTSSYTYTHENAMLAISPCVVIALPVGLYGRAGAILGFPTYAGKTHQEYHSSSDNAYDWTREYIGSMAVGLTGSIGFAVGIAGVKLYLEADVVSLTWAPKGSEVTAYTRNGEDLLATLTPYWKKTRYVDGGPNVDNDVLNNPEYRTSLKTYYSYGSVGLKAGIMIGF